MVEGLDPSVRVSQVALGARHVVLLGWTGPGGKEESSIFAWGANDQGQLGLGDWVDREHPTLLAHLSDSKIRHIASGEHHSTAISGTVTRHHHHHHHLQHNNTII